MIVDTNGLSAWWINEPSFIRHIEQADRLCVPVPALAEFRVGILKSRFREKMTAWLDDALATTTILAADESTTRHYAEIRLQLTAAAAAASRSPATICGSPPSPANTSCRSSAAMLISTMSPD